MVAVLFDMDGVLIDSENYWEELEAEQILPEVVPDQGVEPSEVTGMYYREIYDYLDDNYETAVDRERFLELFEATAREIYREHVQLMDGFHDLLADLQDSRVDVALVTSSPHPWIDIVLERFDLEDSFDAVVSAADVERGKPEPDVYERAIAAVGAKSDECLAVEDSPTGAAAARAAGLRCLGYTGVHDTLEEDDVQVITDTPEELQTLLLEHTERRAAEETDR